MKVSFEIINLIVKYPMKEGYFKSSIVFVVNAFHVVVGKACQDSSKYTYIFSSDEEEVQVAGGNFRVAELFVSFFFNLSLPYFSFFLSLSIYIHFSIHSILFNDIKINVCNICYIF